MRLGVDFSQWGGPLSINTVECWRAQGVNHAIVQYSNLMSQHLQTLQQAGGIETEAYVYLYWGVSPWGQTPVQRTEACIDIMSSYGVKTLWLDAEDSMHPYNEAQLKECEQLCYARGIIPGIYTGRWWWVPNTNNSQAFKHLPLWDANYIGESPNPDLSKHPTAFDRFRPYGGWTQPTIWQWHNTTMLCGYSVDLNALPDTYSVIQGETKKSMLILLLNNAGYLVVGNRIDWIPTSQIYSELSNLIYGNSPQAISQETWEWLDSVGVKRVT